MPEISIVKTGLVTLSEGQKFALNNLLFGDYVDGMTEIDRKAWRRLWSRIKHLEPGEVIEVSFKLIRNSRFHRKFFALLNLAFDAWEPNRTHKQYRGIPVTKNFERFRKDVVIQAGFYEQTFDLKGGLQLEAKSISFSNMDDVEFDHLYNAVLDVLLSGVLIKYKNRNAVNAVIEEILRFA